MVVRRRVWESKAQLLAAGAEAEAEALKYQRASADRKQQGQERG
jgi:hypothetical protein